MLLPWRRRRARLAAQRLAAAAAEQAREREVARQRLLYQARKGSHWSAAPTESFPYVGPETPAQVHRADGGRS
ncbi:hypothetical protein [Micromonospora sp. NPDC049679]|uniref:hypothetical protein n=1 Tax=Micromonospora sp. NPDC049679 TaxID=3155920 RepID=UPI0033FDA217